MNLPIKGHITHQLRLRFFDIDVNIDSDTDSFVNHFALLYRRFCRNDQSSVAQECHNRILLKKENTIPSVPRNEEGAGWLLKTCTKNELLQSKHSRSQDSQKGKEIYHPPLIPPIKGGEVSSSLMGKGQDKGHFRTNTIGQSSFCFTLLSNPDNPWGKPVMVCDGEVWPLDDRGLQEGYAYELILNTIMTRVRSHLLFHAGVVSCNGQGVIIAADSMHGKTTLVFELVRRGFRFLSDEMAALGRLDHYVHPFPRSLWIRKGTLELMGFEDKFTKATKWFGKAILDIEEAVPNSLGTAVPVSHLIVLQNPDEKKGAAQDISGQDVSVTVDRLEDSFIAAIHQCEGVTDVRTGDYCGYPMFRFWAVQPNAVLSRVEVLCRKHKILVMDVLKGERVYPSFKTGATIHTIPTSQAIINLLGHYQGGYLSDVLHSEFGGSSSRLFMELLTIMGNAKCYRISVGPLSEVADLVCRMVGV